MRKTLLSLSLGLLTSLPAAAENLLDIYQLAQQNDPVFRAAEQEFFATREVLNQSKALFLPTLNLSAQYEWIRQDYSDRPDSPYNYDSNGYGLSLNQVIFRNDYFVQFKQADLQVAQASARLNSAAQDLIVRVADAYFQVLAAHDNLRFVQAEKKAIAEQLNQTKQRFKVGLTAITDVHEAQSRYDQSVAQEIEAKNLVATARETLRELIGQYPKTLAALAVEVPLTPPDPQDVDEWVRTAEKRSLALIAAEKAKEIARAEIDRRKSGHYPTLDLTASYNHTYTEGGVFTSFTGKTYDDQRIGLRFNLPIFQGGMVSSQTRQAEYQFARAKEEYIRQKRITEKNTRTAYLNVLSNISTVKAFKQALKSTRTALEATEAGYEVGTRNAVEVLNARREVFRAERDYARSRYNYIVQALRLRQAAGILTESDLEAINRWLQTSADLDK